MKIVYADMSIEHAKFLLSTQNRFIVTLDNSFGVSALRGVIKGMPLSDIRDIETTYLVNCPLAVDMVANEISSDVGIEYFLEVFLILSADGELFPLSANGITVNTDFCKLLLSGGCVAKEGF